MTATQTIKQGYCPECGHNELGYPDGFTWGDGWRAYNVACPACDWQGEEYHNVEFAGYEDANGDFYPATPDRSIGNLGGADWRGVAEELANACRELRNAQNPALGENGVHQATQNAMTNSDVALAEYEAAKKGE